MSTPTTLPWFPLTRRSAAMSRKLNCTKQRRSFGLQLARLCAVCECWYICFSAVSVNSLVLECFQAIQLLTHFTSKLLIRWCGRMIIAFFFEQAITKCTVRILIPRHQLLWWKLSALYWIPPGKFWIRSSITSHMPHSPQFIICSRPATAILHNLRSWNIAVNQRFNHKKCVTH